MNNIRKFLNSQIFLALDSFGISFSFSINNNRKISSLLGVLISFLLLVIAIILFFLLGEDFLHLKNPKSSTSTYNKRGYTPINLTGDLSTIVFSFTKKESNKQYPSNVNITGGFLYSSFQNVEATLIEYKNQTIQSTVYHSIPFEQCNDTFLNKYNFPFGNYYCLDLTRRPLLWGTNQENEYDIYRFIITFCEKNAPVGYGKECRSTEELSSFFKSNYGYDSVFKLFSQEFYMIQITALHLIQ